MDYFQIIGIIIILISAIRGFVKGFVDVAASICATVLSFLILFLLKTWVFHAFFEMLFFERMALVARIVICIFVYLVFYLLFKAVIMSLRFISKLPVIRGINRILGLLLGSVWGLCIVGCLWWIRSWLIG